jgi:uncharacterized protein (TIGR03118 family)
MKRHPAVRAIVRTIAIGAAVALSLSSAAPASASSVTRFNRVDLISDQAGKAPLVDPDLVNAWGLAFGPATPLWVANNGTNTSTIYAGGRDGATPTKAPLTVTIPGGAPTGQVFNDTAGFVVKTPDGNGGPARFIFASEGGDIAAWSPATSTPTAAVLARHVDGAVYKGLTIVHAGSHAFLLAADFAGNRIDVFDDQFNRRSGLSRLFRDHSLPTGYAPFNVQASGRFIFVTFAKQQSGSTDEMAGPGLGFVDRFRWGEEPERIASRGTLNAPWGLAIAPTTFGRFAGDLLVGNFGDGRVSAFRGDNFAGQLRDSSGKPITIDGLWAMQPGTATTGGTGTLWFSAGPDDEQHGLVGTIRPTG